MANNISKKLKIREGDVIVPVNAPADFKKTLEPLPAGVRILPKAAAYNQLHWFVLNKAQMEKELNKILKQLKEDVVLWIYYPKVSSKLQTDLTRDKGWESLLKHDELHWLSLISFDDTWSAFACRLKTEKGRKRESKPKERPIFDYIDPQKKIVRLPDDFGIMLKKSKKAEKFFNELSFTNRKEYVEWIVTAKRPETRKDRVEGSLQRLVKGWKNPRNL